MYQAHIPFKITYLPHVDVNGFDFARSVAKHIQKSYKSAAYFCCGQGATGFRLIYNNQAAHMNFIDHFPPALESCQLTATTNNWQDRISCFSSLQDCDRTVDLFIADPPWWPKSYSKTNADPHKRRQLFDIDYQTHKNMWSWAVDHVVPGGDVFVSRDNRRIDVGEWNSMIPGNFKIAAEYLNRFFKSESLDQATSVRILDHSVLVHVVRL